MMNNSKKNNQLLKMLITAILLAVGYVLPFLIGQVQVLGQSLSPLHIPVLICGLTCGWQWGMALGIILPLTRSAFFSFPPILNAIPMAAEMAVYGLLTGLMYALFRKLIRAKRLGHLPTMLAAMLIAMTVGRIAGGIVKACVLGLNGASYSFELFVSGYFVKTAVGAVLHLLIVPVIVLALEKAKLSPMDRMMTRE